MARSGVSILVVTLAVVAGGCERRAPGKLRVDAPPPPIEGTSAPSANRPAARAAVGSSSISEAAMLGLWTLDSTADGTIANLTIELLPGRVMNGRYKGSDARTGQVTTFDMHGTWSLDPPLFRGQWTSWSIKEMPLPDEMRKSGSEKVLSLTASEMLTEDVEDHSHTIYRRVTRSSLPPLAAAPPAPVPSPAPASPTPTVVIDDTYYVASGDVKVLQFNLPVRQRIAMTLAIDNNVPIDVVAVPYSLSESQYTNVTVALAMQSVADVFASISGEKPEKHAIKASDLFASPLAKKGAYGTRTVDYVSLAAGTYTLLLDNSGTFSKNVGDAPVKMTVTALPEP